ITSAGCSSTGRNRPSRSTMPCSPPSSPGTFPPSSLSSGSTTRERSPPTPPTSRPFRPRPPSEPGNVPGLPRRAGSRRYDFHGEDRPPSHGAEAGATISGARPGSALLRSTAPPRRPSGDAGPREHGGAHEGGRAPEPRVLLGRDGDDLRLGGRHQDVLGEAVPDGRLDEVPGGRDLA